MAPWSRQLRSLSGDLRRPLRGSRPHGRRAADLTAPTGPDHVSRQVRPQSGMSGRFPSREKRIRHRSTRRSCTHRHDIGDVRPSDPNGSSRGRAAASNTPYNQGPPNPPGMFPHGSSIGSALIQPVCLGTPPVRRRSAPQCAARCSPAADPGGLKRNYLSRLRARCWARQGMGWTLRDDRAQGDDASASAGGCPSRRR